MHQRARRPRMRSVLEQHAGGFNDDDGQGGAGGGMVAASDSSDGGVGGSPPSSRRGRQREHHVQRQLQQQQQQQQQQQSHSAPRPPPAQQQQQQVKGVGASGAIPATAAALAKSGGRERDATYEDEFEREYDDDDEEEDGQRDEDDDERSAAQRRRGPTASGGSTASPGSVMVTVVPPSTYYDIRRGDGDGGSGSVPMAVQRARRNSYVQDLTTATSKRKPPSQQQAAGLIEMKCVVFGDRGTGKSSLCTRVAENFFPELECPGVCKEACLERSLNDGRTVRMRLFDTSPAPEYEKLREAVWIPNASVFLILFSLVRSYQVSRDSLKPLINDIKTRAPGVPILLVGTKHDLRSREHELAGACVYGEMLEEETVAVTREEGADLAREIGAMAYAECSAMTGEGVVDVFNVATLAVLKARNKRAGTSVLLQGAGARPEKKTRRCCVVL